MVRTHSTSQTLSEEQFTLLKTVENEYTQGMLALNSLRVANTLTVYGGSLVGSESDSYKTVFETCKKLAKEGWGIVSGGGPGMMTAALSGAEAGGGEAIAFCIDISGETIIDHSDVTLRFSQFSVRKYLLRQSDAFIFAPGGIGTLDELMELLTLMKTSKYPIKPIFLLDSNFWSGYISWFKNILLTERHVIPQEVFELFVLVNTSDEIINNLK